MTVTHLLTVAAVASSVAGLVVLARWSSGERLRSAHLGVALTVAGACGGATLAVGGLLGLNVFGVVHLAYLGITVTVPLIGLGSLGLGFGCRGSVPARVLGVVLLLPAAVGAYATHVEPDDLRVQRVDVPVDPARAGRGSVRNGVLADLQTNGVGDHERRAVDELMAARPDIILVPGDLYQGTRAELVDDLPDLRRLLGRLQAPFGVFFVRGNTDGGGSDEIQGAADAILAGLDIRMLADEVVEVRVQSRMVRIGGTRLAYDGEPAKAVRTDLLGQPADGAITILMSHRPDTALLLPHRPGSTSPWRGTPTEDRSWCPASGRS